MNKYLHNIYYNKDNKTLLNIINDNSYTEEVKQCATKILIKRGINIDEYRNKEFTIERKFKSHIQKRHQVSRYNTGFKRLFALIIDGFVIKALYYLLDSSFSVDSSIGIKAINLVIVLIPFAYSILMHGLIGQTFGKLLMQIKVYDKSEFKNITFRQALMRDLVPTSFIALTILLDALPINLFSDLKLFFNLFLSLIMITWSILEIATMIFNTRKRALHDWIAGTVVLTIR